MTSQPVVFIHGLWIHSTAWEPWAALYGDAGYEPLSPGWPGDGPTVDATRRDPSKVAGYGLADIVKHYTKIVVDLAQRPVVVGHSFGGLIAQQLLAGGHASHAVAIDPGPPKGVTKVPLAQIRTALPVLRKKSNRDAAVSLTERQFRYGFANAVSKDEARELFQRWAIPGPGKPLFEATSATKDHQVPEVVTRQAYQLYAGSHAVTDYHVFEDRGHSLVLDSGWRDVADYTLAWLARH
jgi:non-heme chloroperoxidase